MASRIIVCRISSYIKCYRAMFETLPLQFEGRDTIVVIVHAINMASEIFFLRIDCNYTRRRFSKHCSKIKIRFGKHRRQWRILICSILDDKTNAMWYNVIFKKRQTRLPLSLSKQNYALHVYAKKEHNDNNFLFSISISNFRAFEKSH